MCRKSLGDLPADTRTGPGDENRFLFMIRCIRSITGDRQCGEQHERDENHAVHGAPPRMRLDAHYTPAPQILKAGGLVGS